MTRVVQTNSFMRIALRQRSELRKYFYPTRSAVTGFVAYFCPSLGLKSGPQELSLPDAFHDRSYDSTRYLFCSVVLAIRQCATVGVQQNFPRS